MAKLAGGRRSTKRPKRKKPNQRKLVPARRKTPKPSKSKAYWKKVNLQAKQEKFHKPKKYLSAFDPRTGKRRRVRSGQGKAIRYPAKPNSKAGARRLERALTVLQSNGLRMPGPRFAEKSNLEVSGKFYRYEWQFEGMEGFVAAEELLLKLHRAREQAGLTTMKTTVVVHTVNADGTTTGYTTSTARALDSSKGRKKRGGVGIQDPLVTRDALRRFLRKYGEQLQDDIDEGEVETVYVTVVAYPSQKIKKENFIW